MNHNIFWNTYFLISYLSISVVLFMDSNSVFSIKNDDFHKFSTAR